MKTRAATGRWGVRLIGTAFAFVTVAASAHHSFAAFFDHEKDISVHGKVTEFHFANPHGMIAIEVTNPDGTKTVWKGETNSPSAMLRRGWTKNSVKVGDTVTIDGWPARDGARYVRIRELKGADGKPVGKPADLASEYKQ
jgi:Family of unknown function (DUF6152)